MPRRMRKTRKGGSGELVPLTPAKLREITEHLRRAQGKGELQNVMSDLSEVRKNDPEIFADGGEDKGDPSFVLDAVIRYKDDPEIDADHIREDLETVIDMLAVALDERPPRGARRGRKSRRKTLRQRK
jgi:hypothetical protein